MKKRMQYLAKKTNTTFDGGDDNRLFLDRDVNVSVFAHLMSKCEYKKMQKAINELSIKGKGFEVYAWNDCSGYEYWKEQGLEGSSNYILITASISNPSIVDVDELEIALRSGYDKLCHFDNNDQYFISQNG